MGDLSFEKYSNEYQYSNPDATLNRCWRSFRKRVIQRGGHEDAFNNFREGYYNNHPEGNDITAWQQFAGSGTHLDKSDICNYILEPLIIDITKVKGSDAGGPMQLSLGTIITKGLDDYCNVIYYNEDIGSITKTKAKGEVVGLTNKMNIAEISCGGIYYFINQNKLKPLGTGASPDNTTGKNKSTITKIFEEENFKKALVKFINTNTNYKEKDFDDLKSTLYLDCKTAKGQQGESSGKPSIAELSGESSGKPSIAELSAALPSPRQEPSGPTEAAQMTPGSSPAAVSLIEPPTIPASLPLAGESTVPVPVTATSSAEAATDPTTVAETAAEEAARNASQARELAIQAEREAKAAPSFEAAKKAERARESSLGQPEQPGNPIGSQVESVNLPSGETSSEQKTPEKDIFENNSCNVKAKESCGICGEVNHSERYAQNKPNIANLNKETTYLGLKNTLKSGIGISPFMNESPTFCYSPGKGEGDGDGEGEGKGDGDGEGEGKGEGKGKVYKRIYPKRLSKEECKKYDSINQVDNYNERAPDFTLGKTTLAALDLSESCCGIKDHYSYLDKADPEEFKSPGIIYESICGTNRRITTEPKTKRPIKFKYEKDNEYERTGLRGRGILPKWGPNYESYVVVLNKNKTKVLLEHDINSLTLKIPGRHVDGTARFTEAAIKELTENLGVSEPQSDKLLEIYSGCIEDNRNTDNAWVEGKVYLYTKDDDNIPDPIGENTLKWYDLPRLTNDIDNLIREQCCQGSGLGFIKLARLYLEEKAAMGIQGKIRQKQAQQQAQQLAKQKEQAARAARERNDAALLVQGLARKRATIKDRMDLAIQKENKPLAQQLAAEDKGLEQNEQDAQIKLQDAEQARKAAEQAVMTTVDTGRSNVENLHTEARIKDLRDQIQGKTTELKILEDQINTVENDLSNLYKNLNEEVKNALKGDAFDSERIESLLQCSDYKSPLRDNDLCKHTRGDTAIQSQLRTQSAKRQVQQKRDEYTKEQAPLPEKAAINLPPSREGPYLGPQIPLMSRGQIDTTSVGGSSDLTSDISSDQSSSSYLFTD